MFVLEWWFVHLPAWAWHHIGSTGFAGLVVMCVLGLVYAAATALVAWGVLAVLLAFLRGIRRGYRTGRGETTPATDAQLHAGRGEVAEVMRARVEQMRSQQ